MAHLCDPGVLASGRFSIQLFILSLRFLSYLSNKTSFRPFGHRLPLQMFGLPPTIHSARLDKMLPGFEDPFSPSWGGLNASHFDFWDPFLVYFEGHKSIHGYIHCKGLKTAECYKLSKLFSTCACWLSHGITSKRLRVWECNRPCMNLDILSFMGTFESLNLDNHGQSNRPGKWRSVHGHNCWFAINVILCLFVSFFSLVECFSLFFVLNLVVRPYKRACTFPIGRWVWEIYENLEKVSLNKTLIAVSWVGYSGGVLLGFIRLLVVLLLYPLI